MRVIPIILVRNAQGVRMPMKKLRGSLGMKLPEKCKHKSQYQKDELILILSPIIG